MLDGILKGRKFLFLQGPSSPFFAHLARACQEYGAEVCRIGLAPGDRLYWPRKNAMYVPFRGKLEAFDDFLTDHIRKHQPTDMVMLGDARCYHRSAIKILREYESGITPWVIEHGYLRPGLIAVETWGHGGRSQIPNDWQTTTVTACKKQPSQTWPSSFLRYAVLDVLYHSSNVGFGWIGYPHYRHYGTVHPLREYFGWLLKGVMVPSRRRIAANARSRLDRVRGNLFLFPLQLDGDFQIRDHGTGKSQLETLGDVIQSFRANAGPEDQLVIKTHPLDNYLAGWAKEVQTIARAHSVGDRVFFADAIGLEPILKRVQGVVTINSTVGLTAVMSGVACHVLGRSIYNISGLTHHGPLEQFWTAMTPPNRETADKFRSFLLSRYHVAGTFDGPGALVGARNLALRLAEAP